MWQVKVARKVQKQITKLPVQVKERLAALLKDIATQGPVRGDWPNFSALSPRRYHCHIKKGRPTYVAVWEVRDKEIRLVEVTYVGAHGKAPY